MNLDAAAGQLLDLDGSVWDAIVIGAGPAGAMAARRLSLAGASVLLIERKRFPRPKVCGACLSRAALAELRLAGLGSLVARLGGIDLREFRLNYRSRSMQIKLKGGAVVSRTRFDAALAGAAVDAGARFVDGTNALVEAESLGMRRVRLMGQGTTAHAAARTVLSATGFGQSALSSAGMPRTQVSRGSRIGAGCRVSPAAGGLSRRGGVHGDRGKRGTSASCASRTAVSTWRRPSTRPWSDTPEHPEPRRAKSSQRRALPRSQGSPTPTGTEPPDLPGARGRFQETGCSAWGTPPATSSHLPVKASPGRSPRRGRLSPLPCRPANGGNPGWPETGTGPITA